MSQIYICPEKIVQGRPGELVPEEVDEPYRKAEVTKFFPRERRNFLERKFILKGRRKKKVFVRAVNLSQMKKKIPAVNSHSCFFFEKRPDIKTNSHLE
jgi:hypothetical protein